MAAEPPSLLKTRRSQHRSLNKNLSSRELNYTLNKYTAFLEKGWGSGKGTNCPYREQRVLLRRTVVFGAAETGRSCAGAGGEDP